MKIEKQKRLESIKPSIEIPDDPNRLFQMTKTWKHRMNTPRSESCGPIIKLQHKAVPSWRQGV